MTCISSDGLTICMAGPWRVVRGGLACPFCSTSDADKTRHISAPVHSGWSGYDYICGRCGLYSNSEEYDARPMEGRRLKEAEENIARVAAMPDPACWECGDLGYTENPIEGPRPCGCEAGRAWAESEEE